MREKASKLTYAEKKGIEQEKLEIAKEMLKDNVDIETIMKYIGLSKEELENFKK